YFTSVDCILADHKLGLCGARSAPQNPKSWISKARSAFEIQLLERIGGLCHLLSLVLQQGNCWAELYQCRHFESVCDNFR
ncbi:MAG TPA: hypothetical protein V6C84_12995, partial [Coleofasciculaceae cyanobacterium]